MDDAKLKILAGSVLASAVLLGIGGILFPSLVMSRDQLGQFYFERGRFAEAAESFEDSFNRGVALYEGKDFKKAGLSFAGINTPEAKYNHGNSLVLLGKYEDAVTSYEEALELKPDWEAAQENLKLARLRAAMMDTSGGDAGDQRIGADEIVFDKDSKGKQDTDLGESATSSNAVQELWLKKVQTKPATFLKSKFAYQAAIEGAAQ